MNRERAKELLPIIQAYAEGKTIQTKRIDGMWVDFEPQISKGIGINFENGEYRIKPEEACIEITTCEKEHYRPFNDCDELVDCWERKIFIPAMQYTKQKVLFRPEIWVKSKAYGTDFLITAFDNNNESIGANVIINDFGVTMKMLFDNYTFCDGSVCGVIE